MDYTGLGQSQIIAPETIRAAWSLARRVLVISSAVMLALLISGGIFTFTPLMGLRIAHTNGISMEPLHREGDVVLIKDTDGSDVKVGDVVVFEDQGMMIMHRVIEQHTGPNGEPILVTQGDNVPWPDMPILASQVNGKLAGKIPLLGTLSRLIDADGGFHVYRSLVLTLAVSAVAVWGLSVSVRRRNERLTAAQNAALEQDRGTD